MITVFLRSLLLVCFAVLAMRLMGKRQIGQLQPFELVIAIMIADLASTPMESLDIPLWRGVLPLMATVILHQLFTLLSLKSQRLRAFFSGTPTVIIRDGCIDHQALEKLCFNLNDLLEELRSSGILSPTEVGTAIMETSGKLSVFPYANKRPATPEDLHLQVDYEGIPMTLVVDGRVQQGHLRQCGLTESWLWDRLRPLGYTRPGQVLLCSLDTRGMLLVQGKGADEKMHLIQALDQKAVGW